MPGAEVAALTVERDALARKRDSMQARWVEAAAAADRLQKRLEAGHQACLRTEDDLWKRLEAATELVELERERASAATERADRLNAERDALRAAADGQWRAGFMRGIDAFEREWHETEYREGQRPYGFEIASITRFLTETWANERAALSPPAAEKGGGK